MTPEQIEREINPVVIGSLSPIGVLRDGKWRPLGPGDSFASTAGDVFCSEEYAKYLLAPKPHEPDEEALKDYVLRLRECLIYSRAELIQRQDADLYAIAWRKTSDECMLIARAQIAREFPEP